MRRVAALASQSLVSAAGRLSQHMPNIHLSIKINSIEEFNSTVTVDEEQ
jgi:hypothetical protein